MNRQAHITAHLTMAGTFGVITLCSDERDSALDHLHCGAFDLIVHIHDDKQQRPQKGATMKVPALFSDKGLMIRAWSQHGCRILFFFYLDKGVRCKRQAAVSVWNQVWCGQISLYSSGFFFSVPKIKKNQPPTWNNLFVGYVLVAPLFLFLPDLFFFFFPKARQPNPLNWQIPCLQRKLNLWSSVTHTNNHTHRCTHAAKKCHFLSLFFAFSSHLCTLDRIKCLWSYFSVFFNLKSPHKGFFSTGYWSFLAEQIPQR